MFRIFLITIDCIRFGTDADGSYALSANSAGSSFPSSPSASPNQCFACCNALNDKVSSAPPFAGRVSANFLTSFLIASISFRRLLMSGTETLYALWSCEPLSMNPTSSLRVSSKPCSVNARDTAPKTSSDALRHSQTGSAPQLVRRIFTASLNIDIQSN